jgi:formyl-CoA transferase
MTLGLRSTALAHRIRGQEDMAALNGIRIIDLTQFEAGTGCTQNLAWMGADVIKVEPLKGEVGRARVKTELRRAMKPEDIEAMEREKLDAFYFLFHNANKRSVTIDLRSEKGKELLRELCKQADVFVENYGPGSIERLGFGYEVLSQINPRLVFAQIKGFDPDGPYASFLCFDNVAQPVGGAMSITGARSGPPMMAGPTVADSGTGLHLAVGILGALYQRERTGHGQRVRVAMQEAVINMTRGAHAKTMMTGKPAERRGNGYAMKTAPADIYPCPPFGANDYVAIYTSRATDSQHWPRLLDVIGHPELKDDQRLVSAEDRADHAAEIDELIAAWASQHPKREAMEILQRGGVPAGAVLDTVELQEDKHLRENGTFVSVNHPKRGEYRMPGFVIRMSDSHVPVTAPPLLGEHTREVLGQVLDIDVAELDRLEAENVIGKPRV